MWFLTGMRVQIHKKRGNLKFVKTQAGGKLNLIKVLKLPNIASLFDFHGC